MGVDKTHDPLTCHHWATTNSQQPTVNTQQSTINNQHSTLNTQHSKAHKDKGEVTIATIAP
ncbi:MAG: hypothetical protein F6K31_09750 [Symploca sp. SIO2G7]|nr:hypothetical protein [Symploca sp. SIO2G7]